MDKDSLKSLISTLSEELGDTLQKKIHQRDASLPDVPGKILVTIGMRRVGKTFFLYQQMQKLLEEKIPLRRIFYANFEDDRLLPMDQKGLADLIESFYTLYPENHDHLCYLFLDEIQNITGWSNVVRRFLDTKSVKIFLSGSSAKLLSKDIATALRGRSLAVEVWPYSFEEYLRLRGINWPPLSFGKKTLDHLAEELGRYIQGGGFPEVQTLGPENRIQILQDYVNLVVFKDIVERHEITNIAMVRYLIKALMGAAGSLFSVNKMFNDVKSQGFKVSKNTLYEYLGYVEDAYLAFTVPLFTNSIRKQQTNPKKIYLIDSGLLQAERLVSGENWGILFENLVYLDLRRRNYKVFYYLTEERHEVDFLVQDIGGKSRLFQVAWTIKDEKTAERERRALETAEKELGIAGKLITSENYFEFLKEL